MRRLQVDLKHPEGRRALLRLVESADVWIESFRPGVADRIGIGYDEVRRLNPRIVYCSTSGYGQTGPYAQWAGHDLNYLALGGYLACTGRRADGTPALPGASVADAAGGGMHAAIAILAALLRRGRSSDGMHLDVSVTDGVLSLMSLSIDGFLATGRRAGAGKRHPDRPLRLLRRVRGARRPLDRGGRDRAGVLRESVSGAGSRGLDSPPARR